MMGGKLKRCWVFHLKLTTTRNSSTENFIIGMPVTGKKEHGDDNVNYVNKPKSVYRQIEIREVVVGHTQK